MNPEIRAGTSRLHGVSELPELRLGERLNAARGRAFVGRAEELAAFREALHDATNCFAVHYFHGPGGIGKSMLLRRFSDEARAAGRPVVEVDGRILAPTPSPSPTVFEREAQRALTEESAVLLIDTFDQCQGLETWLWESFLPRLPAGVLVVIAGRWAPDAALISDPGWSQALRVVALRDLAPTDAAALLEARGVRPEFHEPVRQFAGGHPLALSLAAAVAVREQEVATSWTPPRDVVETLLAQVLGEVPSTAHRHALEVCAHAHMTSEELLRAVLPGDVGPLFGWLRRLPFVESGRYGVHPHDVVREALEADLKWRDPQGFAAMHRRLRAHLAERIRDVAGPQVRCAMGALMYLYREDRVMSDLAWHGLGDIHEEALRPADTAAAVRLTTEVMGEDAAAKVGFWIDRQPEAFRMFRRTDTGESVALSGWLRLTEPAPEELAADPVVAAVWEHSRSVAPLRAGEHLGVARFWVPAAPHPDASPALDLFHWRAMADIYRSDRLAWSYVVTSGSDFWGRRMRHRGMEHVEFAGQEPDEDCALFAHDWRAAPVDSWLDRADALLFSWKEADPAAAPRTVARAVLSRAEFDTAVRQALLSLRSAERLSASPLTRSRLVADRPADPAAALREVLTRAIDDLRNEPRGVKLYRALAAAFLQGSATQWAAAERLGIPFSTYRRHLTRGIERICETLWQREFYSPPPLRAVPGPDPC
ncbi:ATP-binding protein [Streptomyces sp. ACA25]|uniref:ATP-binding protein n=1 Tax=Streptomyces sp. ACA25 TaxID=3022596 RepID=UPI0023074C09|nr:ATP-binding protein [Streptomyces sp. ACA25]MDB1087104.1 ATP-binding protein [Streptomyces sp. ACA25]